MSNENFSVVIDANDKWYKINLKEIWKYRELLFLFVKKDFVAQYKQTILGPLWAILKPLMTTVVFTVIFGKLAKLTTADVAEMGPVVLPSFLFYMSGTICWNYFSSVVKATASTFLTNKPTMSKVYYPRIIAPMATCVSHLITFGIQFMLFILLLIGCLMLEMAKIRITPMLFYLPILIVQLMILSTSLGIIVSSLTTKYRDLTMLVDFGLQLLQYGTPVAYGLLLLPEKYINLYLINPVSTIIVTFRYLLFGVGFLHFGYITLSWLITIIVAIIAVLLFYRIEKNFIDTI